MPRGQQRIHTPREILNAFFFYVLRSGCPWRLLPREYPPSKTLYHYLREWRINATFEKLSNAVLLGERLRISAWAGTRSPARASPTPSRPRLLEWVENSEATRRWQEGSRGRKRHLLVDTEGLVLKAKVHSAKIPEQDGLKMLLESPRAGVWHLKHLWLDAGG